MVSYNYTNYLYQIVNLEDTHCGGKIKQLTGSPVINLKNGKYSKLALVGLRVALGTNQPYYATSQSGSRIEFLPLFCGNSYKSWPITQAYLIQGNKRYLITSIETNHQITGFVDSINLDFKDNILTIDNKYSDGRNITYQYKFSGDDFSRL